MFSGGVSAHEVTHIIRRMRLCMWFHWADSVCVCAQSGVGLCIKIFIFLEESFDAEKDTRKTMLESQEDFFPILYVAQIYNEGSKYQIIIKIAFVFSLPY